MPETCLLCGRLDSPTNLLRHLPRLSEEPGASFALCESCIHSCYVAVKGKILGPVEEKLLSTWQKFEFRGTKLEWAARLTALNAEPVVMVSVRSLGSDSSGLPMVFPGDTVPTVKHAVETAEAVWSKLEEAGEPD